MIISEDHWLFHLLANRAPELIANQIAVKNKDVISYLNDIEKNQMNFDLTIETTCRQVQNKYDTNKLNYYVISKSVVALAEKINPEKLIDEHGLWRNGITKEYTGAALFSEYIIFLMITKKEIGAVVINSKNPYDLSAFSVNHEKRSKYRTWINTEKSKEIINSLLKVVLYMVFAEVETIDITAKFRKRYKDRDGDKHLNRTGVKFTVIDKTWAGKITIGGHMRSGHYAVRWTGPKDNPTPKMVWIAPTSVQPYTKGAKIEK